MKSYLQFIIFALICGNALSAPLFESKEILEMNLAYDITKLQIEKENLREDGLPGRLKTLGDQKEYTVEVLSRGKGSFECQQPQIKIKFDKKEIKNTLFDDLGKVKFFTRGTCLENTTDPHQDKQIIANYLIYQIYEKITDYSFKTRLFKVNYTDTSGKIPPYTQYGFFLEPEKNIEKRFKVTTLEYPDLELLGTKIPETINKDLLGKINAFEFMIANYDYGVPGFFSHIINDGGYPDVVYIKKNSKIFKAENSELIPMIYDFDFSRFSYFGAMCFFDYRFFNSDFEQLDASCTVESMKTNLQKDFAKFRYAPDVARHSKLLSAKLDIWKKENIELIKLLGPEYFKGLETFQEAFIQFSKDF